MSAVKNQLKQMYQILGLLYLCGGIAYLFLEPTALPGFTFGALITAFDFYLTYFSFQKMFQQPANPSNGLLVGPLPKLATIIIGVLICRQFPAYLPIVAFLIGICLYPIVFLLMGALDYVAGKK